MIKKASLLLFLLFSIISFSQSQKLKGEWFLDKIKFPSGENLEINNSKFSMFLNYKINQEELIIYNTKFKAQFTKDQIKCENRNLKYWFDGDYLLVQEGNEISFFLKSNDFIKKYPEFKPKIEIRNNDSLIVSNQIIHPLFNHEQDLDEFLSLNMTHSSSSEMTDLYFKAEYILTKDNKISNIRILDNLSPQFDTQFVQALKKAEQYFQNPYGKNMLITKEFHFLKWYKDLKKEEKELFNIKAKGSEYYFKNDFKKAVQELDKLETIHINENRFTTIIKEAYLYLGISHLALGKNDSACLDFKKAGDLTDFNVRNYLINFCKQ